jgi:hypothetical protein
MYYGDLKSDCTKKIFLKNVAIYIMDTITKKYLLYIFFCFKNLLGLVIFITKYGVISAKESANTNKKREKVL